MLDEDSLNSALYAIGASAPYDAWANVGFFVAVPSIIGLLVVGAIAPGRRSA